LKVHNVTLGTAGHIDHGKSELIMTLTGVHPDRLKEEKERGMTIDLGYSFYETARGLTVGVIDVPGHERFIKNMVAGATGMSLVVLVVAADDGVMPQTREHLNIMTVLGLKSGLVALTKTDLVDEELVELAAEDVKELVAGTFLDGTPIVPVSSVTGAGFDALRTALDSAIDGVVPFSPSGAFRMPIQRVFSAKGFGTVVTGVPVSGSLKVGDPVEVFPHQFAGKIRGIQAYDESLQESRAGHRSALNISDVDYRSLKRGHVVAAPGKFRTTDLIEAEFYFLDSANFQIKNMMSVRVHIGTAEVMARIVPLEKPRLDPGDSSLIQLRLEEPILAVPGDPFILRLHSPLITIGGGRIVGLSPMKLKRFKDHIVSRVAAKRDSLDDLQAQIVIEAENRKEVFFSVRELALSINVDLDEVNEAIGGLLERGDLVEVRQGRMIHEALFERLTGRIAEILDEQHRSNPLAPYVDQKIILQGTRLEPPILAGLLKIMESRGIVETAKGGRARRHGFVPEPSDEQKELIERIEKELTDCGATPPPVAEIISRGADRPAEVEAVINFLVGSGSAIRVGAYVFHGAVIDAIRAAIVEDAREQGEVRIPIVRDRFKTSRKWIIPLMEYFDGIGLTYREGDRRFLKNPGQYND